MWPLLKAGTTNGHASHLEDELPSASRRPDIAKHLPKKMPQMWGNLPRKRAPTIVPSYPRCGCSTLLHSVSHYGVKQATLGGDGASGIMDGQRRA